MRENLFRWEIFVSWWAHWPMTQPPWVQWLCPTPCPFLWAPSQRAFPHIHCHARHLILTKWLPELKTERYPHLLSSGTGYCAQGLPTIPQGLRSPSYGVSITKDPYPRAGSKGLGTLLPPNVQRRLIETIIICFLPVSPTFSPSTQPPAKPSVTTSPACQASSWPQPLLMPFS